MNYSPVFSIFLSAPPSIHLQSPATVHYVTRSTQNRQITFIHNLHGLNTQAWAAKNTCKYKCVNIFWESNSMAIAIIYSIIIMSMQRHVFYLCDCSVELLHCVFASPVPGWLPKITDSTNLLPLQLQKLCPAGNQFAEAWMSQTVFIDLEAGRSAVLNLFRARRQSLLDRVIHRRPGWRWTLNVTQIHSWTRIFNTSVLH